MSEDTKNCSECTNHKLIAYEIENLKKSEERHSKEIDELRNLMYEVRFSIERSTDALNMKIDNLTCTVQNLIEDKRIAKTTLLNPLLVTVVGVLFTAGLTALGYFVGKF